MSEVSLPLIEDVPEIKLDTGGSDSAAGELKRAGDQLDEHAAEATESWRGLQGSFSVTGLNEQVWQGLDLIDDPVTGWRSAMASLESATSTFTAEAVRLKGVVAELESRRAGLVAAAAAVTPETAAQVAAEIYAFNADCDQAEQDWTNAQEAYAADLRGISGGEAEELPAGPARASAGLNWQGVFGDVSADEADDAWMLLSGLNRTETREWLDAHPEAAAALAARGLDDFRGSRTDSSRIRAIQEYLGNHDPHNNPDDVDRMAELWNELTPAEQEQLLYQYPAVFGSMNGVPFNDRGRVNQVTVRGLLTSKEKEVGPELAELESRAEELRNKLDGPRYDYGRDPTRRENEAELARIEERIEELTPSLHGLRDADAAYARPHHPTERGVQPGYDTLYVDPSGTGTIVTARGQLTDQTERIMGFTPGTTTTMASAKDYNTSLDRMDGDGATGTYSIYWAGTELPPEVPNNIDGRYNREGGPRLASFDRALELQTDAAGTDPRKVWASHSAGSAMVGSGEKQGMNLDAQVYIAPAGPGQGVERLETFMGDDSGDPADSLPNPNTERYLIQNPRDVIRGAQVVGPAQQAIGGHTWLGQGGASVSDSRPDRVFDDVVLLESGVVFDDAGQRVSMVGDGEFGGHSDYLGADTLALRNVRGVLYEESVYPEVGMEQEWFWEKDPLRGRPEDFDSVNDFPSAPLDQAYQDAVGRPRGK